MGLTMAAMHAWFLNETRGLLPDINVTSRSSSILEKGLNTKLTYLVEDWIETTEWIPAVSMWETVKMKTQQDVSRHTLSSP